MENTILARPIYYIAMDINNDWKNINPYAQQYLEAMFSLENISDSYFADDAKTVILYFLSNATTWRGETAKRIKAELKALVK